jgi:hypothetical protein
LKIANSIQLLVLRATAILLVAGTWSRAAENVTPSEYQIKSAFLYNFIKFVEWPAQLARETNGPIVIGVLGQDPFGIDLETVIEGKRINDRPISIRRFPPGAPPEFCHVLFISTSEKRRFGQILRATAQSPTLTVADGIDGFCQADGMINFVVEAKKVRFQINNRSAEQRGLKISSKLLRLAVPFDADAAAR